jgi:PLD-like domain
VTVSPRVEAAARRPVGNRSAGLVEFEAFVRTVETGHDIELSAFILPPGRLVRSLEDAVARGAHAVVELEDQPYSPNADQTKRMHKLNRRTAADLRRHGVTVHLHADPKVPLHLKAAVVDGVAFLDDRNWASGGAQTIVRSQRTDDVALVRRSLTGCTGHDAHLATRKDQALALEAKAIASTPPGRAVACESESFGPSVISRELAARARGGNPVRVLVDSRALGRRALATLARLQTAGVEVRLGTAAEKMCVAGDSAWVGSANASEGRPGTLDWGLRTRARTLVAALAQRFETRWSAARPFVWAGSRDG